MEDRLSIGQLAEAAGVHVETIRYYQRRGLLAEPPKPPGGHRRYPLADVKRVSFVKRAQALGFSLDDVATLLSLDSVSACGETRALAERKLALIERKSAELAAMRRALRGLVAQCGADHGRATCPIIDALSTV